MGAYRDRPLASAAEATERLVGSAVFKTVGGSKGPRQVRFLSASAIESLVLGYWFQNPKPITHNPEPNTSRRGQVQAEPGSLLGDLVIEIPIHAHRQAPGNSQAETETEIARLPAPLLEVAEQLLDDIG